MNISTMNDSLFTLPDDFGIGLNDCLIYFYFNNRSSVNNKVVFTKNMICLLQQGKKEVYSTEGRTGITSDEVLLLAGGSVLMSETVAENYAYEAILIFFGNQTLADFCARHSFTLPQKTSGKAIQKISRD